MDSLIRRFDAVKDGDLMLCEHRGIAYQADMSQRVDYGADYLAKCEGYADTPIAKAVNAGRVAMLARHLPEGASVLDIGAASGAFLREANAWGFAGKGCDVIPQVIERLQQDGLYAEDPSGFDAVTMWDVIEHIDCPELRFKPMHKGAFLFASVPIFASLRQIRQSRHYRPGEHLYYFTRDGFVAWMYERGFRLLEESTHETDAGRDSIGAFAFVKDLPDYHDHVQTYAEMHAARYYGSSATELHLGTAADVVRRLKPMSILDYGCGRSDLVAHFWRDGARRIERYDPAIPQWKAMPGGRFDLVFCMDVMEHIPMQSVDRVLHEVRQAAQAVLFTISIKPARAKLPDGRNSHVTLLTRREWTRWLSSYFASVEEMPSKWAHELIFLARQPR